MASLSPEQHPPQAELGELAPIPQDFNRGWKVNIDGEDVPNVEKINIQHPKLGVLVEHGLHPSKLYDTLKLREQGGGGAVTIPYFVNHGDGRIYVGRVVEDRPYMGGLTPNVPRGFREPTDKSHLETAQKEIKEETGYDALMDRFVELGIGINPNSTFFDTTGVAEDGRPAGVRIYGLPVNSEDVERVETEEGSRLLFKQEIREAAQGDGVGERIVRCEFVPFEQIRNRGEDERNDGFTLMAAGLLSAHLIGGGVLGVLGARPQQQ